MTNHAMKYLFITAISIKLLIATPIYEITPNFDLQPYQDYYKKVDQLMEFGSGFDEIPPCDTSCGHQAYEEYDDFASYSSYNYTVQNLASKTGKNKKM